MRGCLAETTPGHPRGREQQGFERVRQIGKTKWVVRKRVRRQAR